MDFDWKSLVGSLAPTIATALGGPLAGAGVAAISQALLGKKEGTEQEIAAVLKSADPEILLKLKQADHEFALKMKELDINLEKMQTDDRASAREREKVVKDYTNQILAYAIVAAFIATVAYALMGQTAIDSVLEGTLIGYLSAKCEQVLAYYFGSTKNSMAKTELLAKADAIK